MTGKAKAIYHLGEIVWFGGYSHKIEDFNKFGFVNRTIYFKASALDSANVNDHILKRLSGDKVLFILRKEDDPSKGALWVRLLSEMQDEELIELYNQNSSVKEIFSDFPNTLGLLDAKAVQCLLRIILEKEGTKRLLEFIQNNHNSLRLLSSSLIDILPWEKMDDEECIAFFLCCSGCNEIRTAFLRNSFPSWINNEKVIERLYPGDFPECIRNGLENQDIESLSHLFNQISNPFIRQKLTSILPYEHFYTNQMFCRAMTDEVKASILKTWLGNEDNNCSGFLNPILTTIDPFSTPKSTVVLGKKLYELSLPLDVWTQIEDSVKIWFILFLSFKLNHSKLWINSFNRIYLYEEKERTPRNNAVLAVLKFLSIAFVESDNNKQLYFDEAHECLESAIKDDYENDGFYSDAVKQLICKCKNNSDSICSVKYWGNERTGWCSTYHKSCGYFKKSNGEGIDFWKTVYAQSCLSHDKNAICYISLVDLLHNVGFVPSLDKIYSPIIGYQWNIDEYTYRISGRIIQLDRLFSHMHCRCDKTMKSNYAFAIKPNARYSITRAYCPDAKDSNDVEHDYDVYLNECWNCGAIIDSRDCQFKQDKYGQFHSANDEKVSGFYVCMKCGAGRKGDIPSICPKCGSNSINTTIEGHQKVKFVSCNNCGYESKSWMSKFVKAKYLRRNKENLVDYQDSQCVVIIDDTDFPDIF